ncbi:MAG: hypothetical protein ABL884_11120 [Methyloglobulus sp.]
MFTIEKQFKEFAESIKNICCNSSVRRDENGPFILAFGLKDTHSIELRNIENQWMLELWVGKTAEEEKIVSEIKFTDINAAFECAKQWLEKDNS